MPKPGEDRSTLVDAYHEALLTYGVIDYNRDMCWRDYVLGMLQALLLATLDLVRQLSTPPSSKSTPGL
jgi:hypothetical protein